MRYRHTRVDPVRKHLGRPGPWAQLPWRVLGLLFIAAVLLASQQPGRSAGPTHGDDLSPSPAAER